MEGWEGQKGHSKKWKGDGTREAVDNLKRTSVLKCF